MSGRSAVKKARHLCRRSSPGRRWRGRPPPHLARFRPGRGGRRMGAIEDEISIPDGDPLEAPGPANGCQSDADGLIRNTNAGCIHNAQSRQRGARVLDWCGPGMPSERAKFPTVLWPRRSARCHSRSNPDLRSGAASRSQRRLGQSSCARPEPAGSRRGRLPQDPRLCQAMSACVGPSTAVCSRSMRVMTETIGSITLVES